MQETTNLQKTMSIQACTERVQKIVAVSYPCAKAYVHSFGCQLNVSDGEKIKGLLQSMGFSLTETHEDADVIVFNTCAVRESAEDRVYGMLGVMKKYKETHPRTILILSGCMGSEPKTLEKVRAHYSFIDILMGTASIGELPRLLATYYDTKKFVYDMDSTAMPSEQMQQVRNSGFKASVPIMYGCNNFCTYCIVPYTRGRERSRIPEDILKEVQALAADGVKEITLLGQNVNSYKGISRDSGEKTDFTDLIYMLSEVDGIERIRFMTSHPKDISDKLIAAYGKCEKLCHYIHLPVQAGSSKVLKEMNRHYTREDYLEIVRKLREVDPDIAISTDIIVGFPGETEEEFEETLTLCEEVRYDSAFTFLYSVRKGTPAEKFENQIPEEIKHERFNRLVDVINRISAEKNAEYVGRIEKVLVDGPSKNNSKTYGGRTESFKLVNFRGTPDMIGQVIDVLITGANTFSLEGEVKNK